MELKPLPNLAVHRVWFFIGIGGSGMRPLARLALECGLSVAGSEPIASETMSVEGWKIFPQDGRALDLSFAVVVSSAIEAANPDLVRAHELGLEVFHRSQLLEALLGQYALTIAVAGTHGKTSTTAMIAEILEFDGRKPGFFLGGVAARFEAGARRGGSKLEIAVSEVDESDGSFLLSTAKIRVITNVDADHLEYWGDFAALKAGFERFARATPTGGTLIVCADDPFLRDLAESLRAEPAAFAIHTYGRTTFADLRLVSDAGPVEWTYERAHNNTASIAEDDSRFVIYFPLAASPYALNTGAAISAAKAVGANKSAVVGALSASRGVARRMENKGQYRINAAALAWFDDYGHHPIEIGAVISAMRRRFDTLIVFFQPHRFTRTRDLHFELAGALASADLLAIFPIYPAGETPIAGITADLIASDAIRIGGNSDRVWASSAATTDKQSFKNDAFGWTGLDAMFDRLLLATSANGIDDARLALLSIGAGPIDAIACEYLKYRCGALIP